MEDQKTLLAKVATELKYMIETTFKDISVEDLNGIVEIGNDVTNTSWLFAKKISQNDTEKWNQRTNIEKGCVEKYIIMNGITNDSKLAEYLKHYNTDFYLSSCRVVAMRYAEGVEDALEEMKGSVRMLKADIQ